MTLREFLERHELSAFTAAFEAQRVNLHDLADLTDDDLIDFGLTRFAERKRLKAAIAALGTDTPAPPPPPVSDPGATRIVPVAPPAPDAGATRIVSVGSEAVDASAPSTLPAQLGSYRVLGPVGAGGMGRVVRARHVEEAWAAQQGGDVAIKLIHAQFASDPDFRARFLGEAALGRKVQHPGLVPTWDVIAEGGHLGVVMSFVEGDALTTHVRSGGLSVEAAVRLLRQVGDALDHLHASGIVHRDVKPANIVVRPDGRSVLLDLGIAKDTRAQTGHTRVASTIGTTAWMSPEQSEGTPLDGASDRYALGLLAYALLAGRLPWEDGVSEARMLVQKLTGQLPTLASMRAAPLPPGASEAVARMLSVAPAERFPTCAAFLAALEACAKPSTNAPPQKARKAAAAEAPRPPVVQPQVPVPEPAPDTTKRRAREARSEETAIPAAPAILTDAQIQRLRDAAAKDGGRTFCVAPGLHARKVSNALASYGGGAKAADVVAQYDDTFWGGAAEGFLLLLDRILWKPGSCSTAPAAST